MKHIARRHHPEAGEQSYETEQQKEELNGRHGYCLRNQLAVTGAASSGSRVVIRLCSIRRRARLPKIPSAINNTPRLTANIDSPHAHGLLVEVKPNPLPSSVSAMPTINRFTSDSGTRNFQLKA